MTTYTATTSNGITVTRNSKSVYTHAVLLTNAKGQVLATWTGFHDRAIAKADLNRAWLADNNISAQVEVVAVEVAA